MNGAVQRLRAEVQDDLQAFRRRVEELQGLDLGAGGESVLAQAAVALHHAYGAIEAALARVARFLEGSLPIGSDWHQALLHAMSLDVAGVRPAILGEDSLRRLRSLLGFRHFFRHAYSVAWDPERLEGLRRDAIALRPDLESDFGRLDAVLSGLADATGP